MAKINIDDLAETISWEKFSSILGRLILPRYKKDLLFIYLKVRLITNAVFPGHNKRMVDIDFLGLQTAVALFAIESIIKDQELLSRIRMGVIIYIQNNTFLKKDNIYADAYKNRVYELISDSKLAANFCRHYGIEMYENRKIFMKLIMYLSVSRDSYIHLFKNWKITH